MRFGIPIANRPFRFGDPYYACPRGCQTGTYYDGTAGVCYNCQDRFHLLRERQPWLDVEPTKIKRTLAVAASVAVAFYALNQTLKTRTLVRDR